MSPPTKLLIPAIIALVIAGQACTHANPAAKLIAITPIPTPIDPQALLEESGRVMESLRSFHFRLDHPSGGTTLVPNLIIEEAEGNVISPDKISVEFNGTLGSFAVKSSLITLGDTTYMTNPLTGQWQDVPKEISPLGFFDPGKGIRSMMSHVEDLSLLQNSGDVHRINGSLSAGALSPLVGPTVVGTTVAIELIFDTDSLYLIEIVIDGRVTSTEPDGTVRVITLTQHNEPITIEPPS